MKKVSLNLNDCQLDVKCIFMFEKLECVVCGAVNIEVLKPALCLV